MRPRSHSLLLIYTIFAVVSSVALRSIATTYGVNQAIFFVIGGMALLFTSQVPYWIWYRYRWWGYTAVLFLLLITLGIGTATKGSLSWIRFGSYRFQPSELVKPILMLVLGIWSTQYSVHKLKHVIQYIIIGVAPVALILLQPDLGTSLVILAGVGAVFLTANPKTNLLLAGVLGVALLSVISWNTWLQTYQKERILSFVQPNRDPLGSGYNQQQALIAVGSGGILGQGIGEGSQSTLRFLPERHTDFLFASLSEKTGFIGGLTVILMYGILFGWIWWAMSEYDSPEKLRIAWGSGAILWVQATINIGMNIGLLPVTGVTLPLMSLGGTSILSTAIILGLLESIRRSSKPIYPHLE